jgi:hypothetical protein
MGAPIQRIDLRGKNADLKQLIIIIIIVFNEDNNP